MLPRTCGLVRLLILSLALLAPVTASALSLTGTFTATDFDPSGGPETSVSGSFSISYDESGLTGVGQESDIGVVDAIDVTIDGLSYGTSNVEAGFRFQDGVLDEWFLATTIDLSVDDVDCSLLNTLNEFCLARTPTQDAFVYSVDSDLLFYDAESLDIVLVPEPSAASMLAAGLLAVGAVRRRSAR